MEVVVIPAKAGIQMFQDVWIPGQARNDGKRFSRKHHLIRDEPINQINNAPMFPVNAAEIGTFLDSFPGGHMKGKAVWLSVIILVIFLRPAAAEIYQWTDENGVTHFSDKKPVDLESDEDIKIRKEKYKKSESQKTNDDSSTKPEKNTEEGVVWHDYTEGLRLSKKTGKGAIIIFYADWCPTCKKYMRLFDDPTIITETRKFVMIRVNQDKYPSLSSKYDFDGKYIPRTFALSPDGNVLHKLYPKKSKDRYYLGTRRSNLVSFMKRFAGAL